MAHPNEYIFMNIDDGEQHCRQQFCKKQQQSE